MKKFERLDAATAPDGTVLTLYRHDGAYYILADGAELMTTRRHHSEERLAELVCAPLISVPGARVLIGGLGLGYTLRAALRALGDDAEVVVAELVEAVIRWNENPEYDFAGSAQRDPRVTLIHDDVAKVIESNPGGFDAIMLDIDNGANALTTSANTLLYRDAGVRMAAAALRPGGSLAYWSAVADPSFVGTLRKAGLSVEVTKERAYGAGGPIHVLYVARRPGRP